MERKTIVGDDVLNGDGGGVAQTLVPQGRGSLGTEKSSRWRLGKNREIDRI